MYYAYVLKIQANGRLYIGHTDNLDTRVTRHNTGGSPYTQKRGPWKLVGRLPCKTKSEAIMLEIKLKRMKRPDRVIKYLEKNDGLVYS